jgi:hypothetical protein
VQVERKRLLENMPLRLPILLGNRNQLIVELGVDLWSELLGLRGWYGLPPPYSTPILISLPRGTKIHLDLSISL